MNKWKCPNCGTILEWDPETSFVDQTAQYCYNCAPEPPEFDEPKIKANRKDR